MTDASAAPKGRLELTLRALVLGCLLAVVFTASRPAKAIQRLGAATAIAPASMSSAAASTTTPRP